MTEAGLLLNLLGIVPVDLVLGLVDTLLDLLSLESSSALMYSTSGSNVLTSGGDVSACEVRNLPVMACLTSS